MAKCLRCGAGNEWIEGRVNAEKDDTARLRQDRDANALGWKNASNALQKVAGERDDALSKLEQAKKLLNETIEAEVDLQSRLEEAELDAKLLGEQGATLHVKLKAAESRLEAVVNACDIAIAHPDGSFEADAVADFAREIKTTAGVVERQSPNSAGQCDNCGRKVKERVMYGDRGYCVECNAPMLDHV